MKRLNTRWNRRAETPMERTRSNVRFSAAASLGALAIAVVIGCSSGGPGVQNAVDSGADSGVGPGPVVDSGGTSDVGWVPPTEGGACPSDLGLSSTDALVNLVGEVHGDTVKIKFEPHDKAVDYRVYALPKAGDVSGDAIKGATFRCAGDYEVPKPKVDDGPDIQSGAFRTRVVSEVDGFARTLDGATLGYVATTPADDRVPVYALGDSGADADNVDCYHMRWPESRVKVYTTSADERTKLLDAHYRDDGIAFYAPKSTGAGTHAIYAGINGDKASLYVAPGAEYEQRKGKGVPFTAAFSAYDASAAGLKPLMRVFYEASCGRSHDELVAGAARFEKAYHQGSQPIPLLHYSGLGSAGAETTLVVEALDALCPFQGVLSPIARPAQTDTGVTYPPFVTADAMRAGSAAGELFLGGQGDPKSKPHAIARGCIKVTATKPEPMDFRYDGHPETFTEAKSTTFQTWETSSPTFDVKLHATATNEWGIGGMFGELRTTFADWAADTGGKIRMTPKTGATLSADSFVHVTMEVDIVSTDRRYPQILISDQPVPVQDNLAKGATVIVQTRLGVSSPINAEIQFCDHRTWDVNDQCPLWDLFKLGDGDGFLSPRPELNGSAGLDQTVMFDVWASTSRVYLRIDGEQYGCVDLPPGKLPAGKATVTFGDVLYHSAVDFVPGVEIDHWYPFHETRLHNETTRHFSNLAFSSKTPTPAWDEKRTPCVPAAKLHNAG